MGLPVRARADTVATFRFINVYLMEALAAWVPTTPEMEVKILFGRHLWDLAQHADAFGRRTAELRLGPQASRQPVPAFRDVLRTVADAEATGERLDGFYGGLVPVLLTRYDDYLRQTDRLMDEPTVRVVERAMTDLRRMRQEREQLRSDWPNLGASDDWIRGVVGRAEAVPAIVDFRSAPDGQEVA